MKKADPFLIAVLLFVSLSLSGCLPSLTAINIKDDNVFTPTLRASRNLQSPEESRKSLALDMEVSSASGKSSQYLSTGRYILNGNEIINGPARVDASINTSNVMMGLRGGWIWTIVNIEWMGGVNILDSTIKLESGAQSPGERVFSMGPYFGWKFSLKPNEAVKLYGKGIVSSDFSSSGYGLLSGELGASMNLDYNVALFAGWRWVNLNYAKQYASDIYIDVSGPTVSMELAF